MCAVVAIVGATAMVSLSSASIAQELQVRAEGEHQCWGKYTAGRSCKVYGTFENCDQAYYELSKESCCREALGEEEHATSIGFHITHCTWM